MTKPHIGIFGRMNSGKSTLVNFLTSQKVSIVNARPGTTTDPVRRSFELLDFGPVIFIDTAGFDDNHNELGRERVRKTISLMAKCDLILFVPKGELIDREEKRFLNHCADQPVIIVRKPFDLDVLEQIKAKLRRVAQPEFFGRRLSKGDTVVLVCPIDSEAPAGKLIMPQAAAVRTALDIGAISVTVQLDELPFVLQTLTPKLVVTDSQAFGEVTKLVQKGVELTSFSILLAEQKGDMQLYEESLGVVKKLKNGNRILLIEHCSHQTSCDDIARDKIPRMLRKTTGKSLVFDIVSGNDMLPDDLASYSLAVQCGGCVATRVAVQNNIQQCQSVGLPITNYGMLLRSLYEAEPK